jgi:hypothetical protein
MKLQIKIALGIMILVACSCCNSSFCLGKVPDEYAEQNNKAVRTINQQLEKLWSLEPSNITSITAKEPVAILYDCYHLGKYSLNRLTKSSGDSRADKAVLDLVEKLDPKKTRFPSSGTRSFVLFSSIFIGERVYTDIFKDAIYKEDESAKPKDVSNQSLRSTTMETDDDKEVVVREIGEELELPWAKQPLHITAQTVKNPLAIIYWFDLSGNVQTIDIANSSKDPKIDREAVSLIRKLKFRLAETNRVTPYKYPFVSFISIFVGERVHTDVFRFAEYKGYETLYVGDWPMEHR